MKYLIINADDFGQTPGITSGILEAHSNGVVTSTSMIVNSPHSDRSALFLQDHLELSVGLHFCLTDSEEKIVVDPSDSDAVRRELKRQLELFIDLVGGLPTHMDAHHNIHRNEQLRPLFLELSGEHGILLREHSPVKYYSSFYGQWQDASIHHEWVGVERLEYVLRNEIGEGITELSCHPGYVDDHLVSYYSEQRETELRTLCAPAVAAAIGTLGLSLIGFRDVPSILSRRPEGSVA